MITYEQLEAAKAQGNPALVNKLAIHLMAARLDEPKHRLVVMLYAWSLGKMGLYGEALQYFRMLEGMYAEGSKLGKVQAYTIARQACMLRLMGLGDAAAVLLESLRRRVRSDIANGDDAAWIQREMDKAAA